MDKNVVHKIMNSRSPALKGAGESWNPYLLPSHPPFLQHPLEVLGPPRAGRSQPLVPYSFSLRTLQGPHNRLCSQDPRILCCRG